jgi:hypothetical protein
MDGDDGAERRATGHADEARLGKRIAQVAL